MFYTVYKITNTINDKIYIGVHQTSDINDNYMGSGKHLINAQNKYGIDNFKKEIIEVFDNPEDMFKMESQIVNEEFVSREDTYNIKQGGFGGWDFINKNTTTEKKIEISKNNNYKRKETFKRNMENDDFKLKMNKIWSENMKKAHINGKIKYDTFTGKSHTEETKRRIGEANSVHQQGEGNSQFGTMWIHSLTEQVSKKIKKDEFPEYETQGWLKGRKMKF